MYKAWSLADTMPANDGYLCRKEKKKWNYRIKMLFSDLSPLYILQGTEATPPPPL